MNLTVLTIDDDPAITELLSVLLRAHNFDTLIANDGEEGIRIIKEKSPQLVILDLMMPDWDGWQICKAVRAFNNVPILILSAIDDPAVVASILDAGADDYLVKPVSSAVLVAHLNKLARWTGTLYPPAKDNSTWLPRTRPLAS
ncbi:MAG: response regulator [Chloroflexi bacterium]|nr:response regulator [Chloroflexota bacterium]